MEKVTLQIGGWYNTAKFDDPIELLARDMESSTVQIGLPVRLGDAIRWSSFASVRWMNQWATSGPFPAENAARAAAKAAMEARP